MNDRSKSSLGYQQITVLTASVGFASIPTGSETVLVQAEAQNVRYRDDGTDPTAAIGMILVTNTIYEFTVAQFARMRFIEVAATAKLNISFYGTAP